VRERAHVDAVGRTAELEKYKDGCVSKPTGGTASAPEKKESTF
jgi:hypothetical protein